MNRDASAGELCHQMLISTMLWCWNKSISVRNLVNVPYWPGESQCFFGDLVYQTKLLSWNIKYDAIQKYYTFVNPKYYICYYIILKLSCGMLLKAYSWM